MGEEGEWGGTGREIERETGSGLRGRVLEGESEEEEEEGAEVRVGVGVVEDVGVGVVGVEMEGLVL